MRDRIQVFDPHQDFAVIQRRLPHWSQAGTIAFLTWRTWDSIPEQVLKDWLVERNAWLIRRDVDPEKPDWQARLQSLGFVFVRDFQRLISKRWNDHLDDCHGACVLRRPELSQVVVDCLLHFDGDRYELTDFVIMPNHVHVLAAFLDEDSMLKQCDSWKHFTATKINRSIGRSGRLWQQDSFDHLVRSTEQFECLRRYLADNPRRAKLAPNEFRHYSKSISM
jgi:type I restriction enzyme R subunit